VRVVLPLVVLVVGACARPGVEPVLLQVEPGAVDEVEGGRIELHGEGWLPRVVLDFDRPDASTQTATVSAWLVQGEMQVDLLDVTWVSPRLVSARVPGRVALGAWDVHLVEPGGRELMLASALEVVDCTATQCFDIDGGRIEVDAGVIVDCDDLTYADRDRDGYGAAGTGARLCGPGRVRFEGDCDDEDRFTHPGAGEVCNGLDDDCDGVVDNGVCGDGGAAWRRVASLEDRRNDFTAAASFGPGALWAIGASRAVVRVDGGFVSASMNCPANLQSIWAEPGTGLAVLSGGNNGVGRLTTNAPTTLSCGAQRLVRDPMVGIAGFGIEDGGYEFVGALRDGRVLRWKRGEDPVDVGGSLPSSVVLRAMHASSPSEVYAVGNTVTTPNRMKVFRLGIDGGWSDMLVDTIPGVPNGSLQSVWVSAPGEVFAGGSNGALFELTSRGWRFLPAMTTATLTGVVAFGPRRIYVSQNDGLVRRLVRGQWEVLYDNGRRQPFMAITGSGEDDLWAVGTDGVVAQGPVPR
jgi:hypothetical protein